MKSGIWLMSLLLIGGLGLSSCAKDRTTAEARRDQTATERPGTETPATGVGNTMDNAAMTAKVKSKLATDIKASTMTSIDVDSNNGVVTLTGTVADEQVKKEAEQAARSIDGVVKVENNLRVDTTRTGRK